MRLCLQRIKTKLPLLHFLVKPIVLLLVFTLFLDISFLLYGGEYLAKQIVYPLPKDAAVSECFSQHTTLCKNIDYSTSDSLQDTLKKWITPISKNQNSNGEIIYSTKKCSESWLGLHYAFVHKRQELVCAIFYAWSENDSKHTTHIFIQLTWSMCLSVVDKYLNQTMNNFFRCDEG